MSVLKAYPLRLLVCSLALLGLASGLGERRAHAQSFAARLFDQDAGLGSPSITAVTQDRQGYLWIATENGLFQYSGSYFEEFGRAEGFADPAIYSLLVDATGTLWAGTQTGLYWYGGRRFHEVQYQGRSLQAGMNSMLAARATGELIVQTAKGTFSVEKTGVSQEWSAASYGARHPEFPHIADPNGVGVNARDQLVIGCDESICEGGRVLGRREGVPADYYMAFFRARDGRMWARGRKHILAWRTGDARVRDHSVLFPAGGMHTVWRRFTEDAAGEILTPTAEGFATWDGRRWTETARTSRGPLHGATAVFADREGSIWIGTEGAGLLQSLGNREWENYGVEDGLAGSSVSAMGVDRAGALWVGGNQAATLLPPGESRLRLTPLAGRDEAVTSMAFAATPDGGMWTASLTGQLSHSRSDGRVDIRASIDAYADKLLLGEDGTLWMATSAGLFTVRCSAGSSCTPQLFARGDLAAESVRDLAGDGRGGLWVAGEHGLYLIDGQSGRSTRIEVAGQKQNFRHLAGAGQGELWLAGEAPGFLRVRVEGRRARVVEVHARPELLSDRIQFLGSDRRGRLWIGTDHGVNVLDRGTISGRTSGGGTMSGLTTEDGLGSNNTAAFLSAADGSVWIGTTEGVSHLLEPDRALRRPPFGACIDQVLYRDADILDPSEIGHPARLKMPWSSGATSVRFSALTFRENHALIYHYQLLGLDATPTATRAFFAHFLKLQPGAYTFRVVAEDPVHHVFSAPAELTFTLVPPWYKSWVMHVLLTLLCFGLVNLVWRASNRLLLAQRRRLARMVKERTREIEEMALRDSLTGVLNRRAIMARLEEEVEYARRHGTALCVALIDLDHFKRINDTLGHLAGDVVLREAARRLSASIRASDTLGRYGGEEFILLFRNVEREFGLEHCERVRLDLCGEPIQFEGKDLAITCSIGLAWSRDASEFTPALVARADHAMYLAKQKGRNRVECAFAEEAGVLALR